MDYGTGFRKDNEKKKNQLVSYKERAIIADVLKVAWYIEDT